MTRLVTVTTELDLETEECCRCGITFAMPAFFRQQRSRQKDEFYCPAGHPQAYKGKTHNQELREAQAHARDLSISNTWLADDNMDLANKNTGLRRKNTDLRKRAKNGTCGFCHRTFRNVQRHVETQHLDA
ncbi:hypothetical protein LCGC14_2239600 [marine sediment metagenome]|uniref:C2H2-type domain-containing protein n=1 Tax=marine sediment metagenome TaxID=412755 RepID=A0A0F9DTE5_9ZZZZ